MEQAGKPYLPPPSFQFNPTTRLHYFSIIVVYQAARIFAVTTSIFNMKDGKEGLGEAFRRWWLPHCCKLQPDHALHVVYALSPPVSHPDRLTRNAF